MQVKILKDPTQVRRYLPQVLEASDSDRSALGFLPKSVFHEQAALGKLWVATHDRDCAYVGHLLFGGRYPNLKVIQIFVAERYRRNRIATRLLSELVRFGEENDYLAVRARVAGDLPANAFWEKLDFQTLRTVEGGRTTGRTINLRQRILDVPTLFDLRRPPERPAPRPSIEYEELPVLDTPSYAIDLNVILDLLRRRSAGDAVGSLVKASFNNLLRLMVTAEIPKELERSKPSDGGPDPLSRFVAELPILPEADQKVLEPLVASLRPIVFPEANRSRKRATQDDSDLRHLATCIHHGVTGFVTSELSMLRAAAQVWKQFKLRITSPEDFVDVEATERWSAAPVTAQLKEGELRIGLLGDHERQRFDHFLQDLGIDQDERVRIWNPGAEGHKRRKVSGFVDGRLIGIAAWDDSPTFRRERWLWLYVDEEAQGMTRFVDYVLESVMSQAPTDRAVRIYLRHSLSQSLTRNIALKRGFRGSGSLSFPDRTLVKVAKAGVILKEGWRSFRDDFRALTKIELPALMPPFSEVRKEGLVVKRPNSQEESSVGYFGFDTLISPGICIYPGRGGTLIPIRKRYADELFQSIRVKRQMSLLPSQEALVRLERAYFRSPHLADRVCKGAVLVFYVSGSGGGEMAAVACARVTSTAVLPVEEVRLRYHRQGVLSRKELEGVAGKKGQLHAITFDNVAGFDRAVPFRHLKEIGCVSGANLVTLECVDHQSLKAILREGFGSKGAR